jgi:hypothetical protein
VLVHVASERCRADLLERAWPLQTVTPSGVLPQLLTQHSAKRFFQRLAALLHVLA